MGKYKLKTIEMYGEELFAEYSSMNKEMAIENLKEWLVFDTMRFNRAIEEDMKDMATYHRKRLELYESCLYHLTCKKEYKVKNSKAKTIKLTDDYFFRINMRHISLMKNTKDFRDRENLAIELATFGSILYHLINENE